MRFAVIIGDYYHMAMTSFNAVLLRWNLQGMCIHNIHLVNENSNMRCIITSMHAESPVGVRARTVVRAHTAPCARIKEITDPIHLQFQYFF